MENNEFNPTDSEEPVNENQKPLPRLYSEGVIMGFAFFFSPLYASFLVIANLREVNARKGIIPVIIFAILPAVLSLYIVTQLPQKLNVLTIGVNFLGGLVLNLYFGRKYIPQDMPFEKKTIQKPLFVGLIVLMALFILSAITQFIATKYLKAPH